MGVYGLTSYLYENNRLLSSPITLDATKPGQEQTVFVVDGWSFIYHLFHTLNSQWIYGGEYRTFAESVTRIVETWLSIGIKPYFVFDGAEGAAKSETRIKRLTRTFVNNSILFYRTSSVARSTSRFLADVSMRPPLIYQATIEALSKFPADSVEIHHADGEADPFCVELAAQVNGYVVSTDSDFVILHAKGYKGYVPFNQLSWITPTLSSDPTSPNGSESIEFDDLGFQVVKRSKTRKIKTESVHTNATLPPDLVIGLQFTVYDPKMLASHFQIQTSFLPLLGSLLGNDITNQVNGPDKFFFERSLAPSQRVSRVAMVMKSILNPSKPKPGGRKTEVPNSGLELIELCVSKLLVRPDLVHKHEQEKIVETVIDSILQYSLIICPPPPLNTPCTVHESDLCHLNLLDTPLIHKLANADIKDLHAIRDQYVVAYRNSLLSPQILSVFDGGFWPPMFIEDPDKESCQVTIGRGIRIWIYSLLEHILGIRQVETDEESSELGPADEEDEDELIDVVEEDSESEIQDTDPLAHLEEALRRTAHSEEQSNVTSEIESVVEVPNNMSHSLVREVVGPIIVTEYVRRGSRVAEVEVEVPTLASLYPAIASFTSLPQLESEEIRMDMFFHALHSDVDSVRTDVRPDDLALVVALRWVIYTMGHRSNMEDRWTRREAQSLLASCLAEDSEPAINGAGTEESVSLVNRHIQLSSQFLCAFGNVTYLIETLLLTSRVSTSALPFSGRRFHALLVSNSRSFDDSERFRTCWTACQASLEDNWGTERGARGKKERKRANGLPTTGRAPIPSNKSSLFSALADIGDA